MNLKTPYQIFFSVMYLLLFVLSCLNACAQKPSSDAKELREAIVASKNYLSAQIREDGQFIYRVHIDENKELSPSYNMLRHAGSIYSLNQYYQFEPDQALLKKIKLTSDYLIEHTIAPISSNKQILGLWSDPAITHSSGQRQIKLGGIGLGLVALSGFESSKAGSIDVSLLAGLGSGAIFLQKPNGNFYSKYIPSDGGRWDYWESLFYPGEAALGLLMLFELKKNPIYLQAAIKALDYRIERIKLGEKLVIDHWALIAFAKLFELSKHHDFEFERKKYKSHALAICNLILKSQVNDKSRQKYYGGFSADGRTTPTATRLEGLLAARTFLSRSRERDEVIERAMKFLLAAQIKNGKYKGGFPRAIAKLDFLPKGSRDEEYFNGRVGEIRIDYVQHALSAMLEYYRQFHK